MGEGGERRSEGKGERKGWGGKAEARWAQRRRSKRWSCGGCLGETRVAESWVRVQLSQADSNEEVATVRSYGVESSRAQQTVQGGHNRERQRVRVKIGTIHQAF